MSKHPLPVFGDTDMLLMGIFRRYFRGQDIHIGTLFAEDMKPPILIARRDPKDSAPGVTDDEGHVRPIIVAISVITDGLEAEATASQLQEAVHHALMRAVREQWVVQGEGSIAKIANRSPYSRKSDWQSSTGVVQYASLPKEYARYESVYLLHLRPPRPSTIHNPFISPV